MLQGKVFVDSVVELEHTEAQLLYIVAGDYLASLSRADLGRVEQ